MYRLLIIPAVCVLAAAIHAVGLAAQTGAGKDKGSKVEPLNVKTPHGQPLSAEEKQRVKSAVFAHLKSDPKKGRVRVLRMRVSEGARDGTMAKGVVALTYNYDTGKAQRIVFDLKSGKVLEQKDVAGQPTASNEEEEEARSIIRADKEHAALIKGGAVFDKGAFVVGPPQNAPATKAPHRYLVTALMSKDESKIERVVTVDLSDKKIARSETRK